MQCALMTCLSPVDIIGEINRQFQEAIIVTDVGQHQMLVSQYAEITPGKQLIMSGGLGTMGYGLPWWCRCQDRQSGQTSYCSSPVTVVCR